MSDPINAGEQAIELERLLVHFTNALSTTVEALDSAFTHRPGLAERSVIYQIPKMSVSIQMTLTVSQGKVRGILFNKSKEDSSQQFASTINLDFVATPRNKDVGLRRNLSYTVPMTVGEDVRIMQLKLQRYFEINNMRVAIATDGEYGLQTQEAVIQFQQAEKLYARGTGIIDAITSKRLLEKVPDPAPLVSSTPAATAPAEKPQ